MLGGQFGKISALIEFFKDRLGRGFVLHQDMTGVIFGLGQSVDPIRVCHLKGNAINPHRFAQRILKALK